MLIRLIEIKVRFSNILRFILFNEQPYNLTNSFSSLNCAPKQLSLSCNKAKKLDPNGLLFAKIHEIAVFCGILCINHATALSVAVSKLIQHNGAEFLPRNDAPAQVHFCTPLITIPYAPLRGIWT